MHMPDRWGYLYFVDKKVGTSQDELVYPYNQAIYKLLWAMFYAQQDNYSKQHNYLRATEQFFLTDKELKDLPADARIAVEATQNTYQIAITNPAEGVRYVINNEGRFRTEKIPAREVKNWLWMRLNNRSDAEWKKVVCVVERMWYFGCHVRGIQ